MATAQLQQPEGLITQADALLKLLGGTKTTTSPGDTGALQKTFADLQGTDYEAMLKAIFQQAGGQIPGIQQAMGNAIGARSGGNSAVQAALQKLLAQTSTGAMDQVAKLQAQNFATQANVGGNIAQATKGTTQKTGTDVGGGLANAAKLVALLQGAKTLGVDKWVKDLAGTGTADTPGTLAGAPAMSLAPAAPNMFSSAALSSAQAPQAASQEFNPFAGYDYSAQNLTDIGIDPGSISSGGAMQEDPLAFLQTPSYDYSNQNLADIGIDPGSIDYSGGMEEDPLAFLDFADGGLVTKKAQGYADGGTVRAGGSRRSANPAVDIRDPDTLMAQAAADKLRGQFGVQGGAVSSPAVSLSAGDIVNKVATAGPLSQPFGGSGGSGSDSGPGFNTGPTIGAQAFGNAVGKAGAISNISGVFGGPTLGPVGGVLGLAGQLARAPDREAALGVMGKAALNIASPGLGSLASFAANPSITTGVNTLASLNPVGALWGATSALTGMISPGEVATNAVELANPNQMMTPEQQSMVEAEQAAQQAASALQASIAAGNPNSAGLTSQANDMEGDALGNLMGLTNSFGTGRSGSGGTGYGSSYGGNIGTGGFSGGFQGSFGSGSVGGTGGGLGNGTSDGAGGYGGSDNGYADGGTPEGVADNLTINVSPGEFVMSADVVETLGEDFFNQLQAAFHTPAAQQRKQG